ncbi:hypothetical protein QUA45_02230 [Microcoleus sp. Pol12A5]
MIHLSLPFLCILCALCGLIRFYKQERKPHRENAIVDRQIWASTAEVDTTKGTAPYPNFG